MINPKDEIDKPSVIYSTDLTSRTRASMGVHALIPAAIQNSGHVEAFHDSTPAPHHPHPHPDTASALYESYPSYASAAQQSSNCDNNQSGPSRFTLDSIRTASSHSLHPKDPQDIEQGDYEAEGEYGPIITGTHFTNHQFQV